MDNELPIYQNGKRVDDRRHKVILNAEQLAKVDEWKRRNKLPPDHPEAMTIKDWREAMEYLRGERKSAHTEGKKKAAKEPSISAEKILEGW